MSLMCSRCKEDLPEESFSRSPNNRGRSYVCKSCHNIYNKDVWYVKNSESQKKANRDWKKKNRTRMFATKYGVTEEEIEELFLLECCRICERTEDLCIDHCHSTGKVRGLLCSRCNKGLGFFQDDPELLKSAIKYLA